MCVRADDRFRGPPPTPPGYQGISLGDVQHGVPRPPHLKPPDYSVALQRSKLLQSPSGLPLALPADGLIQAKRLAHSQPRPGSVALPGQPDSEDDDEQVSAV
ncbi:hypothetical protein COCON_G00084760 [Conger conger]|uniref:Uncharacterized protein n=1 Tax=Conger conger TaxID=82655 RepID=A0A9Q1I196_CONCO|nr:hypothetical protein COCON_G00084760 [Conger conger]